MAARRRGMDISIDGKTIRVSAARGIRIEKSEYQTFTLITFTAGKTQFAVQISSDGTARPAEGSFTLQFRERSVASVDLPQRAQITAGKTSRGRPLVSVCNF